MDDQYSEFTWPRLIYSTLRAPTYHLFIELVLIIGIIWLLCKRSYRIKDQVELTAAEKQQLLLEWTPDELVPADWEAPKGVLEQYHRCASGPVGKYVTFVAYNKNPGSRAKSKPHLNLAGLNFLNLVGDSEVADVAITRLRHYGVGSCGPRGFYGTFDVHLELETAIASFLRVEYAVVYSYGAATISSAIPSYAKRNDVIFADEGVHHVIYQGLIASRSKLHFFRHNDMAHLEDLLIQQSKQDEKDHKRAMATRRFIVVEGLYLDYGDICPLKELVTLKYKYKVRILLDETLSFGVLGSSGRGVTEYYGIDINDIDLVTGSLETAIGASGGFCAGTKYVADHQTLSGQGYCFSASLPPMLAAAAHAAVQRLASNSLSSRQEKLLQLSRTVDNRFISDHKLSRHWRIGGHTDSPVKHLRLQHDNSLAKLERVCKQVSGWPDGEPVENPILLTVARHLQTRGRKPVEPSIRLALNCDLSKSELEQLFKWLQSAHILSFH